jgi:hypothetical protein
VYSTESAEQGASFDASVGTITTGTSIRYATALPASTHLPPPTATTQSTRSDRRACACVSISASEHSPPKIRTTDSMPAARTAASRTRPCRVRPPAETRIAARRARTSDR